MSVKKINNFLVALALGFVSIMLIYIIISYIQFDPNNIKFQTTSSKIYDSSGEFLWELSRDNAVRNSPVEILNVPKSCIDGIVAVEDKTFWVNNGIDQNGMARLVYSLLTGGGSGGGSTISQQVVKNLFLNIYNRDPLDKLNEIVFAIKLNSVLSKEQILSMYLNNVFFGDLNYGIESASQNYFGKSSSDLTLAECSYLVGIPQLPGIYNPYGNLEKGINRQKIVLNAMLSNNFISEDQYSKALTEELSFKLSPSEIKAPHFVQFVKDIYYKDLGDEVYDSLKIRTTYNYSVHKEILNELKMFVDSKRNNNINNGAAVILDRNNNIISMVGSTNFFDNSINGKFNSTLGLRQPGTTYLPLIYSISLDSGYKLSDLVSNVPLNLNIDNKVISAENLNKSSSTIISIEDAIRSNSVIPAVNLVGEIGIPNIKSNLNSLVNFNNEENKCNQVLVLEGCEMSLLDLTSIYAVNFVNDTEIKFTNHSIIDPKFKINKFNNADLVKEILNLNSIDGWTVQKGVTINNKDFFAIAFNQNYTIGVWVGNTKGDKLIDVENLDLTPLIQNITNKLSTY